MSDRFRLPQLHGGMFVTDGGLETTLIFHRKLDLPHFAAFHLLRDEHGRSELRRYFESYVDIAQRHDAGLILESATWRANDDWAAKLGYSPAALDEACRAAIAMLRQIRQDRGKSVDSMILSGCLGPRGDGYVPASKMTADAAEQYHRRQIAVYAQESADLITAMTMNYPEEALGIARAALAERIPSVISFTVETDGRLPNGQTLGEAIDMVDSLTAAGPAYYMINCAHPTHFSHVIDSASSWAGRIRGLRANASSRSHAELNESPDLDAGNPSELGGQYAALLERLPNLNVLGGCCGTDDRHVDQIARACAPRIARRMPPGSGTVGRL
jgi:S-methylmethionine-dependent homocysteine/selenocysteine methylase